MFGNKTPSEGPLTIGLADCDLDTKRMCIKRSFYLRYQTFQWKRTPVGGGATTDVKSNGDTTDDK